MLRLRSITYAFTVDYISRAGEDQTEGEDDVVGGLGGASPDGAVLSGARDILSPYCMASGGTTWTAQE